MSDSEAMLDEANRRAHKAASELVKAVKMAEKAGIIGGNLMTFPGAVRAARAYEEIEQRQIEEATR